MLPSQSPLAPVGQERALEQPHRVAHVHERLGAALLLCLGGPRPAGELGAVAQEVLVLHDRQRRREELRGAREEDVGGEALEEARDRCVLWGRGAGEAGRGEERLEFGEDQACVCVDLAVDDADRDAAVFDA